MEGVNNTNISTWLDPNPGYGTHITGPGSSTNGFDATNTNNASMYTFNNATQTWATIPNTSGILKAGNPYRILVRGSRAVDLSNNAAPSSVTTLRATGTLQHGNVVYAKPGGGGTTGMTDLAATWAIIVLSPIHMHLLLTGKCLTGLIFQARFTFLTQPFPVPTEEVAMLLITAL